MIGHNSGDGGWVSIQRAMRDHPLVGFHLHAKPRDANVGAMQPALAFIDLIMECRYQDGSVMNGGRKMQVRRGELVGAISYLAARWNWSPKAVRRWLDRLESDGMIARFQRSAAGVETELEKGNQEGNQAALIRLCNYEIYQSRKEAEGQSTGQSEGNQGAIEGQSRGNNNKDNKGTKEQGNKSNAGVAVAIDDVFDDCEPEPSKSSITAKEVLAAFQVYAKAAEHFGLGKTTSLTDSRKKRIAGRLTDIGGLEAFTEALRALRFTADPFVKFLRGKTPPRPGDTVFRLDIDRLLQTDGKLGDVLARLLDISRNAGDAGIEPGEPWRKWSPEEWERQIDQHANGTWPVDKLGFPPGRKTCACPADIIDRRRLTELYDTNGIARRVGH